MNTYEVLSLLFLGGSFLIALFAYADGGITSENKKAYLVTRPFQVGFLPTRG